MGVGGEREVEGRGGEEEGGWIAKRCCIAIRESKRLGSYVGTMTYFGKRDDAFNGKLRKIDGGRAQ